MILTLFIQIAPAQEEELTSEQQAYLAQAEALWNSLDQQQGEIALPNGVASLNIPESFNYLNPDDAKKSSSKCGVIPRTRAAVRWACCFPPA